MMEHENKLLIGMGLFALIVSGIHPYDRTTWLLEIAPVLIGVPILIFTSRSFPLTALAYRLIFIHALILMLGGHYTYALVPPGFWVQDLFDLGRNHYDRLGHLAQGFIPAILTREVLLRCTPLHRGGWLFSLVTAVCLAMSACYEFIEWWAALIGGESADAFLGTQGDVWDTQWDMFLAMAGAIVAQALLSGMHDRELERNSRRAHPKSGLLLAALCIAALSAVAPGRAVGMESAAAKQLIVDEFDYANSAAAAAAWAPQGGSPGPLVAESGPWGAERLTVFPCDYTAGDRDRGCWDRDVTLDLSSYAAFALRVYCRNPAPIATVTLYFRSGSGWYAASVNLSATGWSTLVFHREQFVTEDSPTGWDKIDGIRFSPWRGSKEDTSVCADRLRAYTPAILLVRPTKTAAAYGEDVDQYCAPFLDWLGLYDVEVGEITDEGVETGLLDGASLAILPYNPVTSAIEVQKIEAFVQSGGKLIVCYVVDSAVTDLLGVNRLGWKECSVCAMRFSQSTMPGLPARAGQASWNFIEAAPAGSNAQITATWEDCTGKGLDYPALLCSPTGAYLTHVLLDDDPVNKQQMLLAVVGRFVPDLKRAIAGSALNRIGRIALYGGFGEAARDIRARGPKSLHPKTVAADLKKAADRRSAAGAAYGRGDYAQTLGPAFTARKWLQMAYALCQLPLAGEFRAAWNHSGTGAWPGDWGRSAEQLSKNGFTAVLPNMLWGGLAHYPSRYLPRSDTYRTYGDQIAQCVAACKPLGVQVHVWKVNWNLGTAPQSFITDMRSRKRTQVDVYGKDVDWLCPSHPRNRKLELNALMEAATRYAVDGIHFDYIRYPDETTCYCSGCRTRFEAYRGAKVTNWPDDCYSGTLRSEYRNWRCLQITALVREVHDRVKAVKPEMKISAAVFNDYPYCRTSVGQDWVQWIKKGYLDFVCPMDYTTGASEFAALVSAQRSRVKGLIPMYPGIGASLGLTADGIIVQILETRRQATAGFTLFNYDSYLSGEILDLLGKATTHPVVP